MLALATAGHPGFITSDIELRRDGPSYTVETLAQLQEQQPGRELVLIVGSDTYPEMESWKEPRRLFEMCTVAVVDRPPTAGGADGLPEGVARVEGSGLPISASDVRRRLREGKSVRYLVPEAVADYIAKRELYR